MTVYLPATPKPITSNNGQLTLANDVAAPSTPTTLVNSGVVPAGRYLVIARAVVNGSTTPSTFTLQIAGMAGANHWIPDGNAYTLVVAYMYTFSAPSQIWLQVNGPTGGTVKRLEVVNNVLSATMLHWIQIA